MSTLAQATDTHTVQAICSTADCDYPVEDVDFWTGQARQQVAEYWRARSADEGNPASPEGLCTDCGAEWLSDLQRFIDEHRCQGYCSPYSNCECQLMLAGYDQ